MTELMRLRKKGQITLPQTVREQVGIYEGDLLEFNIRDNEIVIKLKEPVEEDQSWFWTKRWQEGERQADEDIKAGRVHHFETAEECVAYLNEKSREKAEREKRKE